MKNLDALLGEGEPERREEKSSFGLDALRITNYAFEKAYAYAMAACDIARRTIECGGYLIAPKEATDRIVTDSFLARNQDVSDGLFTIEAEDVIKAGREINEMGYRVLGWWHSHGFLKTFFSATDDNGQRTILNEIAAINYITQNQETEVGNLEVKVKKGKIVLFDRANPQRKYEIEINGNPSKLSIAKLRLLQEKRLGFAYGLVVNANKIKRNPYAEIATRELCGFCKNSKDESVPVDVEIFGDKEVSIDEEALREEMKERVNMRPKFFGFSKRKRGSKGGHSQFTHSKYPSWWPGTWDFYDPTKGGGGSDGFNNPTKIGDDFKENEEPITLFGGGSSYYGHTPSGAYRREYPNPDGSVTVYENSRLLGTVPSSQLPIGSRESGKGGKEYDKLLGDPKKDEKSGGENE